jgi:hypothetical protein
VLGSTFLDQPREPARPPIEASRSALFPTSRFPRGMSAVSQCWCVRRISSGARTGTAGPQANAACSSMATPVLGRIALHEDVAIVITGQRLFEIPGKPIKELVQWDPVV